MIEAPAHCNVECRPDDYFLSAILEAQDRSLKPEMVERAVRKWCDNVVCVGRVFSENGDVDEIALKVVNQTYDYDNVDDGGSEPKVSVLFKPTQAFAEQTFRPTKGGALAYFVGCNPEFPYDAGFKLKPYVHVCHTELRSIELGPVALAQCKVRLTEGDGSYLWVDKSFAFKICQDGRVRIVLHHSSLPYPETDKIPESRRTCPLTRPKTQ